MSDSPSFSNAFRPTRIVSGGQTGVDRAALDFAIANDWDHGGWCPAGRLSEDGRIPDHYRLTEIDRPSYAARTRMNVRDTDATLVISCRPMGAGTALTLKCCRQCRRPFHHLAVRTRDLREPLDSQSEWVLDTASWLSQVQPDALNIAGPRESSHPGVYLWAHRFLETLWNTHRSGETD